MILSDEAYLLPSREQRMREILAFPVYSPSPLVKIEAWLILRSYCSNPFRVLVWVAGKNIQYLWWQISWLARRPFSRNQMDEETQGE